MTARPKRFRILRRSASGLLIASALLVATRAELPAAAKLSATPAPAQKGVDETTQYFVNGVPSSEAEADNFIANNDADITLVSEIGKASVAEFRVDLKADRKLGPQNTASVSLANAIDVAQQQDTIKRKPVAKKKTPPTVLKKQASVYKPTDETLPKITQVEGKKVAYDTVFLRDSSVRVLQKSSDAPRVLYKIRGDSGERVVYNESVPRVLLQADSALRTPRGDPLIIRDGAVVTGEELPRIMLSKPASPDAQGTRVRVRGQTALAISNEPLVFVDGVLMKEGSLKLIDPNQIENVEVIKGAKAIEMYGAGAANGVINIKMKRP